MARTCNVIILLCIFSIPVCAFDTSTLSVQESQQYIPDPKKESLDNLTALTGIEKQDRLTSCKDMILKSPPIPNDPDVNLVYLNVYTFCVMQAVLRTFLDAHSESIDSTAKQEVITALSTLSTFMPALLSSYYYAIPAFEQGLRNKITEEGRKIQQDFPEPIHLPMFSD
jgi:hypothetical protein